jgi:hypothetical protein
MTRIKTEDVVELLDCPFCASEARLTDVRNGRAVVCSNARCDASSAVFNGEYADGLAADRWNTRSATPIERLREENARIVTLANALVAKLDECERHITDAFLHRQLRCGDYTGPNYGEELKALRAALTPSVDET